jgi:Leucine-rich repeat (LRR) protein
MLQPQSFLQFLGWLKFLNLSHSYCLVNSPDFCGAPNLENISLKFCTSLTVVHESIVKLKGLLILNLKGCISLRKLPTHIHQLKSLKKLIISGCSKLNKLPEELDGMASLEVLDADGICQSLSGAQELSMWHIFLLRVSKLRRSPAFTWPSLPQSLTILRMRRGNMSDQALPKNLGNLSSLYWLDLSHNPIKNLPESIKELKKLRHLDITGCNKLLTAPELPQNLHKLSISKCQSLKKLTNIPNLFRSFCLAVHGCPKLVEIEKMFTLQPIEKIGVEMMQNLGLDNVESVKSLKVKLLNLMTGEANYFPIQVIISLP